MRIDDKIIEIAAEKMMFNHHGIMNGYSMDYCRGIVQEIAGYLQTLEQPTQNHKAGGVMRKWEYKVILADTNQIQVEGEDGWEVYYVQDSNQPGYPARMWLKRPTDLQPAPLPKLERFLFEDFYRAMDTRPGEFFDKLNSMVDAIEQLTARLERAGI